MSGSLEERVAAAICASRPPEPPDGLDLFVDDECRALAGRVIAALRSEGLTLIDQETLEAAIIAAHSGGWGRDADHLGPGCAAAVFERLSDD